LKRWYSIAEAAAYFSIKKQTLYALAARGRLPKGSVLRLGRQIRIDVSAVENAAGETKRP
jgi:excisionase family DNA binding protein